MKAQFPQLLKRYGDSVMLALPKWAHDEMGITPDQTVQVNISERDGEHLVSFRVPIAQKAGA